MGFLQFGIALFVLAINLGSLFCFDAPQAGSQEPLLINQIAIDPSDPSIIYAAARPQGLLKSTDRGESWRSARTGLTNTSAYFVVINPLNPKILYLGTFGGGIYKSEGGGERWFEVNQGLGNTNIHALALNPLQPDQLIVSTSTGELYRSDNGGRSWASFNEGLPPFPGEVISSLLIFPGDPGGFFLAQEKLFRRPFSSPMWQAVEQSLSDQVITALAYDPRGRILYAGTLKAGLFQTILKPHSPATNPVSFQSRLTWEAIGRPLQKEWVRLIALDPSNPSVLYATVVNRGLFKSTNKGVAWQEINVGLPEKIIESLAIDPADPKRLYAGTHNHGLFLSRDGGYTWRPPATVDLEPVQQIIASLASQPTTSKEQAPRSEPPPAFAKCNQCHGWTDPGLNQKATYWRVAPNRRDWRPTVTRMSQGAGLAPEEEEEIIRFLTAYSQPGAAADEEKEGPFVIHEIALNPQQSHILYAVTSNYGILQSADGGATWRLRNEGLQSYTHHAIAVHPLTPAILYAGAWGGGVTKSVDGGDHWAAVNDSLGNTAIEDLVLDPSNPEQLYVATTTGVFKSPDGGARWMPWSEGLPVSAIEIFECLLALPSGATELLLGTSRGLYQRGSNSPQWEVVSGVIAGEQITALAFHPKGRLLYAGTRRNGLFKSSDGGKSWVPFGEPIKRAWVSDTALDPQHPEIIYVATRGDGIFKSVDGGATWRSINQGLPVNDIRSLAIDPQHPAMLYAGTTHHGLLKSSDSGNRWVQLAGYPRLTHTEVVGALSGPGRLKEELSSLALPLEFSKCNQCHGWADPFLNLKQTYWRVPPNRRDWGPTVTRMGVRAQLTQEESSNILEFLNAYTTASVSAGGQIPEQEIVRQRCSHCHALQVMEDCVAGDCRGSRVVRLLKPPPWDFVVDWMHRMGAEMTETEQQAILGYLERSYPATPYPIRWVKVPASLGKGGWNVVSLKEYAGYLYVGLEGNGKIFRSHDGTHWQEVANTDHYTVYGITHFRGALYAGTHDPDPRIWKSTNGLNWRPEASLLPEDRGVISLGIFKRWLYAGTGRARIYRSLNGRQWEQVGDLMRSQEASFPHWVRFLIPFRNYLYAGLEQGPVYRTSDGLHWEPISQPITGQVGARGAAVFQSSLYIGTTGTGMIWRTRDGETWEMVFTAPSHNKRGYVSAMAAAGGALYASVDGYVYRSVDGARWEEVGNLGPYTLEAMAVFNNALYVGTLLPPQAQLYRASVIP